MLPRELDVLKSLSAKVRAHGKPTKLENLHNSFVLKNKKQNLLALRNLIRIGHSTKQNYTISGSLVASMMTTVVLMTRPAKVTSIKLMNALIPGAEEEFVVRDHIQSITSKTSTTITTTTTMHWHYSVT